jgi:hypothetical protein
VFRTFCGLGTEHRRLVGDVERLRGPDTEADPDPEAETGGSTPAVCGDTAEVPPDFTVFLASASFNWSVELIDILLFWRFLRPIQCNNKPIVSIYIQYAGVARGLATDALARP